MPLCEGEDIKKYNDIIYDEYDEDVDEAVKELGCVAPRSKESKGAFPYNTATECNETDEYGNNVYPGTKCKLGNLCGAKGNAKICHITCIFFSQGLVLRSKKWN